jgi:UDP-GlcNAc:undecaprenyl-phosphate GlcNAc-1-phosphate transferase
MDEIAGPFVLALGLGLGLVPLCRLTAVRAGFVATPRQDRWHQRPTALMGGVAIAVSALVAFLAFRGATEAWALPAAGLLAFSLGLADDLASLKPSAKLVAQIAIASLIVFLGYRLHWLESLTADTLLTIFWIVGITNAFNLLDNMDGLAAGIALIAGTALLLNLLSGAHIGEAKYLAALLGATAAFLVFNVHPASIFMGDSGSLFLGLSLAAVTLNTGSDTLPTREVFSIMAIPVMVLLVPIFDTTLVTVSRLMAGRRADQGGRDHSSHRLVAIGLSERMAVNILWVLAGAAGAIGVAIRHLDTAWAGLPAATFLAAMIIFAVYLARVRVYEAPDADRVRSDGATVVFRRLMLGRRVAEVLLDVWLVSIAYYGAYRLRFEGPEFVVAFPRFLQSLPLVVGIQAVIFLVFGLYRGVWRYFGLMDAVVIARSVALGTLTILGVIVYLFRFEEYSRGVFVIYAALLMILLTGSRASFRLIDEFARRRQAGRRLVIYGAGAGGSLAVRELLNSRTVRFQMLGFIDDDPSKRQVRVQGHPVLGGYDVLKRLIEGGAVEWIVLSTRMIDVARLQDLERMCAEHQVRLSRLDFRLQPLVQVS